MILLTIAYLCGVYDNIVRIFMDFGGGILTHRLLDWLLEGAVEP